MNESIPRHIRQLTQALISSARARDWPALARLDAEVSALLRRLTPIPAQWRNHIDQLRKAHLAAQTAVRHEAGRIDRKLKQFHEQQDGLRAYQQMEELG